MRRRPSPSQRRRRDAEGSTRLPIPHDNDRDLWNPCADFPPFEREIFGFATNALQPPTIPVSRTTPASRGCIGTVSFTLHVERKSGGGGRHKPREACVQRTESSTEFHIKFDALLFDGFIDHVFSISTTTRQETGDDEGKSEWGFTRHTSILVL